MDIALIKELIDEICWENRVVLSFTLISGEKIEEKYPSTEDGFLKRVSVQNGFVFLKRIGQINSKASKTTLVITPESIQALQISEVET